MPIRPITPMSFDSHGSLAWSGSLQSDLADQREIERASATRELAVPWWMGARAESEYRALCQAPTCN